MYKLKNLQWLPKPHVFEFVKDEPSKQYIFTSSIIFAFCEDKVLLVNVKSRGWDFAGGRIEKDETILECAKRELLEETGYSSDSLTNIGFHTIDCINNEKGQHTAQSIYLANDYKFESNNLEEDIAESKFIKISDLSKLGFEEWKIKLINHAFSVLKEDQEHCRLCQSEVEEDSNPPDLCDDCAWSLFNDGELE